MKKQRLIAVITAFLMSVVVNAMDYPDIWASHERSVDEPYEEFNAWTSALYGTDNYLRSHTFVAADNYQWGLLDFRSRFINDDYSQNSKAECSDLNWRTDDKFGGSYGINKVFYNDGKYVFMLMNITGGDNQIATIRVYRCKNPLETFSIGMDAYWENNSGRDTYYRVLMNRSTSQYEKDKLNGMQMKKDESQVYFVSPTTLVIDPHFGSSSKERYFKVSGKPTSIAKNLFDNLQSPKQQSGRFNVTVPRNVGLYAISNPYDVTLEEVMSLNEFCQQYFPAKVLSTRKYAQPANVNYSTDQYAKRVTLTWKMADAKIYDKDNAAYAGKWYVYRRQQGETAWTMLRAVTIDRGSETFKYEDKDTELKLSTPYEYRVCFYPNYWLKDYGRGGNIVPEEDGPMDEFSSDIAHVSITPTSPFTLSPVATPAEDHIDLSWSHAPVPSKTFSGTSPTFTIQYQKTNSTDWIDLVTKNASSLKPERNENGMMTEKFTHKDGIESSCVGYMYRVVFDRGDDVEPFISPVTMSATRINGEAVVTSVKASKGSEKSGCYINWDVKQVSSTPTTSVIRRRDVTEENWTIIHTIEGTNPTYSFFDQNCESGRIYEYEVSIYTACDGQLMASNYLTDIGFAKNYGTISGQVVYGTGDAVDSVRVVLRPNTNIDDSRPFYYSANFEPQSCGIHVPVGEKEGINNKALAGNFTISAWIKPTGNNCNLITIVGKEKNNQSPWLTVRYKDSSLLVDAYNNGNSSWTASKTPDNDRWSFIFLSRNSNELTLGMVDADGNVVKTQIPGTAMPDDPATLAVGMQTVPEGMNLAWSTYNLSTFGSEDAILMDEVRVYGRALTDIDILRSYNHMPSGTEKDLALYWPMDEGLETGSVYDQSFTNEIPNNAHGKMVSYVSYSEDTPNQSGEVECYGITDKDGSYVITGVPFSGNGTNYTITPVKGTHEFNTTKLTRYISNQSLVYSGVNFTDVSYFPVHGTVRYAGTTIPVDSCTFEVDGTPCVIEGKPVMTDVEGKFTISVPIGNHYITVKRDGHVFANSGRYPQSGTHGFFAEAYNMDFDDATLVNFTGRIVGGYKDQKKPVGFNQSVNNIGRVQMTLTPTDDRGYINAKKTVDGTTFVYDFNTESVAVPSDTISIQSTSYRGFGSVEECKKIYITTDPKTGEFSVMVPPISYRMSEQTLVANSEVRIGESRAIDLSNQRLSGVDTLRSETGKIEGVYHYANKYVADYHTQPVFKVNEGLPFGESEYNGYDEDGEYTIDNLYTQNGNSITYKFGYPIFVSANEYSFDIEAYESFVNADDPDAEEDQQPLSDSYVQISNALTAEQSLIAVEQTDNTGKKYEEGTVWEEKINGIRLDSLGRATYTWCAGLPNTNAKTNHAQSITMQLIVSGKSYDWVPADDSGLWRADGSNSGPGMKGVNVGAINMGNNFVTEAPDKVFMVLRDPPGAGSSATWKKGSTVTISNENTTGSGVSTKNVLTKSLGAKTTTLSGVVIQSTGNVNTVNTGVDYNSVTYTNNTSSESFTIQQDISTSSNPEYVGSWGDVYVGYSRNQIFGDARQVYIPRSAAKIDVRDVTGFRDSVNTTFVYSQAEILTLIIPGYQEQIKKLLKDTYGAPRKTSSEITHAHYYSNLPETDPKYGLSNFDKAFGNEAGLTKGKYEGPSYAFVPPAGVNTQDTIQHLLNQIKAWENIIKQNEQEKVEMYEDRNSSDVMTENISFDGGAKVSRSYTSATDSVTVRGWEDSFQEVFGWDSGMTFNDAGVVFNNQNNMSQKTGEKLAVKNDYTQSFSFSLSDNVYCDHSVDVYFKKSEDSNRQFAVSKRGWSPIFRTRAGHTFGPYEDGDSTLYYVRGTEIMAKTIQMEVPQLIIDEPVQSNIPNGGKAYFKVKMSNQSYSNTAHFFKLSSDPKSYSDDVELMIDGHPVFEGVTFPLAAGSTIEKTIELSQGDKSVLDYNNIVIRLRSTTQCDGTSHWPIIESVVPISAHFVPVSSDVTLKMENNVVNTATGATVNFSVSDFDLTHQGLKALRLQYRYNNNPEWTTIKEWVTADNPLPGQENLKQAANESGGIIKVPVDMKEYSDGDYYFRVQSATAYGNDGEVTKESEVIHATKDTERPTIIMLPQPTDGILDIGDVISAEFNEDIAVDKITQDNNIEVTGTMRENSKSVHDVGALNTLYSGLTTQNKIDLRNRSFTAEFWAKYQDGFLLSFGTDVAMTTFGTSDKKTFFVIGGQNDTDGMSELYDTDPLTCEDDEWVFWQFSYKARNKDDENDINILNLTACYGDQVKKVVSDLHVPDIISNGKVALGVSFQEKPFADFALWNYARGEADLAQGMKRKSGLEDGLWHYWKMDEGHGTVAEDIVGGNHIEVPANNWFFNNVNYSAHLIGQEHLAIPMNDCNMDETDSYALEFWFKAEEFLLDKRAQQILRTSNDAISLSMTADRHLTLTTKTDETENTYESVSTYASDWHHVLLNVQRGMSAMLYVDGKNQMTLQEKQVPGLACDSIYVGDGLFGDIDEIRIWNGQYSSDQRIDERFEMVDTSYVKGLVRYYPFEHTSLDEGNQLATTFSPHNAVDKTGINEHDIRGLSEKASTTPPLKKAPERTNLYYTFTASDRKLTIDIDEEVLNKLEGSTVNISLKNIPDMNGNSSNRISWNAYIRRNPLRWSDKNDVEIETPKGEKGTFTREIVNLGGTSLNWKLNMPSWLTAKPSSGILNPRGSVTVEFTTSDNIHVGNWEDQIGLTNAANNMTELCNINLHVIGDTPDWAVDKSDKECGIPMTAHLVVDGAYSDDESDIVAAFIEDECVGISHVQYNDYRNAYFVNMTIYGGEQQKGKEIYFKAWDASRGVTFAPLTRKNEGAMVFNIGATPYGSYDNPEILKAEESIEQTVNLKKGWNWVSFYVDTRDQSLNEALKYSDGKITTVKTQTKGAEWNSMQDADGNTYGFMGSDLVSLNENSMYAIKATEDLTVTVSGTLLTKRDAQQDIYNGWTWIRNPFYRNQSITSAFSGFTPVDADVLQSRDNYAQWSMTYNRWEGMTSFIPGTGYKYYSGDSQTKSIFEDVSTQNAMQFAKGMVSASDINYGYADNMLVIAKLMLNNTVEDTKDIAATATNSSKHSFTTMPDRDYYVFTVSASDESAFTFQANVGGKSITLYPLMQDEQGNLTEHNVTFMADAVVGTFASPVILTNDRNITGIRELKINDNEDYEVYSLQGILIFKGKGSADELKRIPKGVYIVNGRKMSIM